MARSKHKSPTTPAIAGDTPIKATSTARLVTLLREDGGKTAIELATAVGWQVHSIRGLISGTLKKRTDLQVTATRVNGVTRYSVTDRT